MVAVGVLVGVLVAEFVGVPVGVLVAEFVGVPVAVSVNVLVGVLPLGVLVGEFVGVLVAVFVVVLVGAPVTVFVSELVGMFVGVLVDKVKTGVGVGWRGFTGNAGLLLQLTDEPKIKTVSAKPVFQIFFVRTSAPAYSSG
jgi:hypothetical protein